MSDAPRFPVFVSIEGKDVLIVGGGKVASRRARVLLEFGAAVTVISPEISRDMRDLLGRVEWRRERYAGLNGKAYTLIVAASDDREVNRQTGNDAAAAGVPVSVADSKTESTFWFPAIVRGNGLVAGLTSENGDHAAVKRAAEKLRRKMRECPEEEK